MSRPVIITHGVSADLAFAIRFQQQDFQSQPPALQRETLERVKRLIAERPDSYLAKHWRSFYVLAGESW